MSDTTEFDIKDFILEHGTKLKGDKTGAVIGRAVTAAVFKGMGVNKIILRDLVNLEILNESQVKDKHGTIHNIYWVKEPSLAEVANV